MSTIRKTQEYPEINADQAYKLAENALDKAGFKIWKKRPLGWLLMVNYENDTGEISGNVSCRPGSGASITLTLESDQHEESFMTALSDDFFAAVDPEILEH